MASTFTDTIGTLRDHYGSPATPAVSDPFEQVLWQLVAYLADDDRRQRAFNLLRTTVGLTPEAILNASDDDLLAVTRTGGSIAAEKRAARIRKSAELTQHQWESNLALVLGLPPAAARKALMQYPMIGEPGADKILLFAGAQARLVMDSNGLRVLLRLGYGSQAGDYRRRYRSVVADVGELQQHSAVLTETYLLLRMHGKQVCKRTKPACDECPVSARCAYYHHNA